MRTRQFFPLVLSALLVGCAAARQAESDDQATPDRSAILVRGSDISGTVLDGLGTRIPAMQVTNDAAGCPRVIFRGQRSIQYQGNPSVYVDGTQLIDTCMLQQIPANDVDFIEVYPSGSAPLPAIRRNPFGLILIYRRRE